MQDLLAELWQRYSGGGAVVARSLLGDLLPETALDAEQRHHLARTFYAMVRLRRRAGFALTRACPRRLPEAQEPHARALVSQALAGHLTVDEAAERWRTTPGAGVLDWRKVAAIDDAVADIDDPVARFGLRHSLPDWVAARFLREFGDEADAWAEGLNSEPPLTIRANAIKTTRDALREQLAAGGVDAAPTAHAPHGLHVEGSFRLFSEPAFQQGLFEQQDEASQLCAVVVAPPPRGRVLDACAGSGGKALALAAELANRGDLLAIDVSRRKLLELRERRRRAGVDNVRSRVVPADGWPEPVVNFAAQADRILLDVPCDGVGAWRRRPDGRWRLREAHLATVARRQRLLLDRALACLHPGARLIYATCTVFAEANEDPVRAAVADRSDLELVRVAEVLGGARAQPLTDASGTFLELAPHRQGCDGFFAAVLRRRRIAVRMPEGGRPDC